MKMMDLKSHATQNVLNPTVCVRFIRTHPWVPSHS